MKIAIAGTGYVGLSLAVLLAQNNDVTAVDVVQAKVEQINARISPIADKEIEEYLKQKPLSLTATTDGESAYKNAEIVVIATPTNYDPNKNYFDTSSVEGVVQQFGRSTQVPLWWSNPPFPLGLRKICKPVIPKRGCCLAPNFWAKGRHFTTICIPAVLSSVRPRKTNKCFPRPRRLPTC